MEVLVSYGSGSQEARDWEKLFATRPDLVGGDIEQARNREGSSDNFRGPIVLIRFEGNNLIVKTEWMAVYDQTRNTWRRLRKAGVNELIIDLNGTKLPQAPPKMGVEFPITTVLYTFTFYPRGGQKLLPSQVQGQ